MVSKASDDFPEPEGPVNTMSRFFGSRTETRRRLCSAAPRTSMNSCLLTRRRPRRPPARRSLPRGSRSRHEVEPPAARLLYPLAAVHEHLVAEQDLGAHGGQRGQGQVVARGLDADVI